MKSVKQYPEHEGSPDNIQFLKGPKLDDNEHLAAHDGNFQNSTNEYYDPNTEVTVDFEDYIPGR